MQTNDTKLTNEQLLKAYNMYSGVRTHTITRSLKNIINYVYDCAIKNESKNKEKR